MERRRFDASWHEESRLADGTKVTLRLLGPADRELLRRGFEKLSPASRYRRFLGPKPSLSEAELRYLTEPDGEHHLAIGAVVRERGVDEGIGVARCIRLRDRPDVAEAAITVVDAWQGRGLGRLLLHRLMAAAWERGLRAVRGSVLTGNDPMRNLLRAAAPEIVEHEDGEGVVAFELPIPPPEKETPPTSLERLLALFASGVVSLLSSLHPPGTPPESE